MTAAFLSYQLFRRQNKQHCRDDTTKSFLVLGKILYSLFTLVEMSSSTANKCITQLAQGTFSPDLVDHVVLARDRLTQLIRQELQVPNKETLRADTLISSHVTRDQVCEWLEAVSCILGGVLTPKKTKKNQKKPKKTKPIYQFWCSDWFFWFFLGFLVFFWFFLVFFGIFWVFLVFLG